MSLLLALAIAVHVLAAIAWVGGMAFAYVILRPSAGPLEPPERLALWRRVFDRFLPWVWASVLALFASGYVMLFTGFGGFAGAGVHIHVMHALAIVMAIVFFHLYFGPWPRLGRALDNGDVPAAGAALDRIRRLVAINLPIGLLTAVVGASGRYWG